MVGTSPACCARAANGYAAAPPRSVMKSRRFIRSHRRRAGRELFLHGGDRVAGSHSAAYLLIPGKEGRAAATMQCDGQEFCCRTMAWRYCIRSRDGYIIAAREIQVIEPPFSVRPVTNGGPSSFLRVQLQ